MIREDTIENEAITQLLNHELLSSEDERRLIADAQSGNIAARNRLVEQNQRLILSVATKYLGRGIPLSELLQVGNFGLFRAIKKFDLTTGNRLSTYATPWIHQVLGREIDETSRTIRVPVHLSLKWRQLARTRKELQFELGRDPSLDEIAEKMEVTTGFLEKLIQWFQDPLQIDEPVTDEKDGDVLGHFVGDDSLPSSDEQVADSQLRETLADVLATLSPREAKILDLRFGLTDGRELTLEEVGQKFGVTRERIRQIEAGALRKLRHPRRARLLRDYLE